MRDWAEYYSEVRFDQQRMWQIRVHVSGAARDGEVSAELEATPRLRRRDLLVYGVPFVLLAIPGVCFALRGRGKSPMLRGT
jgi:hypothetical protein